MQYPSTFRWSVLIGLAMILFVLSSTLVIAAPNTPLRPSSLLYQAGSTITPEATITTTASLTITTGMTSTSTLTTTATVTATATPVPTPTVLVPGTNPDTAVEPTGEWVYVLPGQTQWYKMSKVRNQLDLWINANGQQGLRMAIYAPDQQDLYGTPVGRGSYNKFEPSHDLYWTGRSRVKGTWYVTVTSGANIPISYSMDYARVNTTNADRCAECHGDEIQWWDCVGDGCQNLENEYNH